MFETDAEDSFSEKYRRSFGESGVRWLNSLESIVNRCADHWRLGYVQQLDAEAWNYVGVSSDRSDIVVKVFYDERDFNVQAGVLEAIQGDRMVQLVDRHDECQAMLIERVHPSTTLDALPADDAQMKVAADLIQSLRKHSPMPFCRHVRELIAELDEGKERICNDLISRTKDEFAALVFEIERETLVHGDLHHGNILESDTRGWLMIDPEGLVADPYFDAATILRSCVDKTDPGKCVNGRARVLCDELALDHKKLVRWVGVTSLLAACWSVGDNSSTWRQALEEAQFFGRMAH